MSTVNIDSKLIDAAVREAIASTVAASLSPEAFKNVVTAILNSKDGYRTTTVIESAMTDGIKQHLAPVVEEWIQQNRDELVSQVFDKIKADLAESLGDRIVLHITSTFTLPKKV